MLSRLVAGALVAIGFVFAYGEGTAFADDPPRAPALNQAPAPAPPAVAAPPASAPQAQPHGAVVVATADGTGPAARALAFDVYRDADLRPSIDDATARVLAGDAPPEGAPARLKDIAELRGSIAHAGSELVVRRLLASLGTELGATLVVSVGMDGSHPVVRVLRSATTAFERVEIAPTVEIAADGARTFRWPGATTTLHGFLLVPDSSPRPQTPGNDGGSRPQTPVAPAEVGGSASKPPAAPPPAPLAPKVESSAAPPAPAEPRPFYKSPWFWGSAGGAALVGLSVFLISRATSSSTSDVHLTGRVGP
jgi:hypothetical protein